MFSGASSRAKLFFLAAQPPEAAAHIESDRHRAVEDQQARDASAPARLKRINDALIGAERAFIDDRGLRGRPWYKHEIYAPGVYTGYGAQPLTDFRQALDDRNSADAKAGLERVIEAIKRATNVLKHASE